MFEPDQSWQYPRARLKQGAAVTLGKCTALENSCGESPAKGLHHPRHGRFVCGAAKQHQTVIEQGPPMNRYALFQGGIAKPCGKGIQGSRGSGFVSRRQGAMESDLDKLGRIGCVKARESGHGTSFYGRPV